MWRLRPWQANRVYRPALAWCWAGFYFAACLLIAMASGASDWVLQALMERGTRAQDFVDLAHAALATAVIAFAYGVIWPRGTFTDGRDSHLLLSLSYGGIWGLCQGLLFLSLWLALAQIFTSTWLIAVSAFLVIGSYNGLWHRFVWDRYVSPPHNYQEWNGRKVMGCHVPNLFVTLSHLALYGDAALFIAWQALALALSARAMRFPAPWDAYTATPGEERSLPGSSASRA